MYKLCVSITVCHINKLKHHSAKKPVTTMLTYPWKCTVLHCNHLGNTWKPLVLMTRHLDYCPSAIARSSAPVVSRCFPGGYNVKLYISRGRLAWWLLAFLHSDMCLSLYAITLLRSGGNYHHSMFHNPTAAVNLFHVGKQYLTLCKAKAAVTRYLIGRKIISNVKHADARNSLPILDVIRSSHKRNSASEYCE